MTPRREWRCERFAELDRLIAAEEADRGRAPIRRGRSPGSREHHRERLEEYAAKMRAGETPCFRRQGSGHWGTGLRRRDAALKAAATRKSRESRIGNAPRIDATPGKVGGRRDFLARGDVSVSPDCATGL
jgi:hypothetical protein